MWLQIFQLEAIQKEYCRALVLPGLSLSKSNDHIVICIHYLVVSSPHAAKCTTSIECTHVEVSK